MKAIALHGLGLYLYAGEDLPQGEEREAPKPEEADAPRRPKAPVSKLPAAGKVTVAQIRYIERLLEETGSDLIRLLEFFGIEVLEELTSQSASRAIRSLGQKRRAA